MRRKIPSNSALMAFESAARHGSFARAADELERFRFNLVHIQRL